MHFITGKEKLVLRYSYCRIIKESSVICKVAIEFIKVPAASWVIGSGESNHDPITRVYTIQHDGNKPIRYRIVYNLGIVPVICNKIIQADRRRKGFKSFSC